MLPGPRALQHHAYHRPRQQPAHRVVVRQEVPCRRRGQPGLHPLQPHRRGDVDGRHDAAAETAPRQLHAGRGKDPRGRQGTRRRHQRPEDACRGGDRGDHPPRADRHSARGHRVRGGRRGAGCGQPTGSRGSGSAVRAPHQRFRPEELAPTAPLPVRPSS